MVSYMISAILYSLIQLENYLRGTQGTFFGVSHKSRPPINVLLIIPGFFGQIWSKLLSVVLK